MSRVKIEDLSVERTLGGEESQVRGGGVHVNIGIGGNRPRGNQFRVNQVYPQHYHQNVWYQDTSHWDYIPAEYIWCGDHYDCLPGHWEYVECGYVHH